MNSLNNIGNNIKGVLDELHVDQNWLAERLGVTQATISLWLNNKRIPRMDKIQAIADITDTTTDRILFGEDYYITKKLNQNNIISIPIYGEASCGAGTHNDGTDIEYIEIPRSEIMGNPDNFFAVRACGDSMVDAHIPDGAICIFRNEDTLPDSGKIITCAVNENNAFIKRYKSIGGQILLRSENAAKQNEYEDIIVGPEDFFRVEGWLYKVILDGNEL